MHCHCGTNNRAPRWTFTDPCKPKLIIRFSCGYSVIYTVLWNLNMHTCISILIHSLFGHVLTCLRWLYFNAHAYMYTCFRCARNLNAFILYKYILPSFAEVKVLQQQNMLNVHRMPTLIREVFKWSYEHHFYGHTFYINGLQVCEHEWTFKESWLLRAYSFYINNEIWAKENFCSPLQQLNSMKLDRKPGRDVLYQVYIFMPSSWNGRGIQCYPFPSFRPSIIRLFRIQFPLIIAVIHGDFQMKFGTWVCHKNTQVDFKFGLS